MYIDGYLASDTEKSTGEVKVCNGDSTNDLYIATSGIPGNLNYFDGSLDEIRVYNRSLSASEVQTLYNQPSDVDVDGLSTDWEDLHFGSGRGAEPGDDPDGDGFDNLEEFERDIDPNRFDVGEVRICITADMGVNIGWNSVSGTNYVVEWTASLASNNWEEVRSVTGGADGDESVIDDLRETSQGYYRIVLP